MAQLVQIVASLLISARDVGAHLRARACEAEGATVTVASHPVPHIGGQGGMNPRQR
jgi:hypothetical protein